ncbi:Uma2 family endonuclease [Ornithinimicrobium faecis]|uniref:Uma2 family endonuclease n=1 Tax=Ornithinimicrobium faecis TaxID=2934158 RepID=UPI0021182A73|nr:Uma2 family endonuclease [Ornithinimicrobium sp. HY1745]
MSITEVGIYTVEDLHAYREQREDMTVQLIDGELIWSPSPGVAHQVVSGELVFLLSAALPPDLRVLAAPLDLRVGERTVVQPDLMVVPRSLVEGSEVEDPPVLAVEILSPSSRRTDLVRKPEVLGRFGVEHYWVVDPLHPAIRVFRLVGETYQSGQVVGGDDLFETKVPFSVRFRPADLGDPAIARPATGGRRGSVADGWLSHSTTHSPVRWGRCSAGAWRCTRSLTATTAH